MNQDALVKCLNELTQENIKPKNTFKLINACIDEILIDNVHNNSTRGKIEETCQAMKYAIKLFVGEGVINEKSNIN